MAGLVDCGSDDKQAPSVVDASGAIDATSTPTPDGSTPDVATSDAGSDALLTDAAAEAAACAPGELACDGGCLSVTANNQHCGSCTTACGANQTCFDSGCVSPITADSGTTCDTVARAAFPAIVTADSVYLVQGIPANAPTPHATTTRLGISGGQLDLSTCDASSNAKPPVAEYGMGQARVASSVYLIAGIDNVASRSAVYRSNLGDGGLGPFVATNVADGGAPVALQTSRYGHAIVQTGNYVYAIGGWTGTIGVTTTTLASIERATVDPVTGDFVTNFAPAIDPATNAPATLALPRIGGAIHHQGSRVYYFGGQTGVGTAVALHAEVQMATIDASGNLSSFTQVGTLPTPLIGASKFVGGGTLYLAGGATGYSNPNYALTNAVLAAPIAEDGTVGAFATTTLTLPYAQCCGGSVTIGKTLYVIEGLTGSGFTATTSVQSLSLP